ncbi:MAG TPA: EF-Tu/IF-2/RF-3 family GTPase [Thermoplasmata archaeon]|nr:EF-Tu/IF-2/RF-3 family GTPase [Thermoplasmata archaeon]
MSGALTLAFVGAPGTAKELGKKSTQSDITLYHDVHGDRALTLVEPSQYPEKFASLLFALALSERAIFIVDGLNRSIAETAATVDLFDLPVELRHGPAVGAEELRKAFKGLRLVDAPTAPLDLMRLREELATAPERPSVGPVRVVLDHYFPVKGVGTVALGFVQQGTLTAHATLKLLPTAKSVEVRSVQVHDVDVPSASAGERVGVALKGIEVDELSRGQVLAAEPALPVATRLSGGSGRKCPYYRGDLGVGAHLHALVGLQFVPAAVTAFSGETITVETDRPVVAAPGATMILADLSAPVGPRSVGRWTI